MKTTYIVIKNCYHVPPFCTYPREVSDRVIHRYNVLIVVRNVRVNIIQEPTTLIFLIKKIFELRTTDELLQFLLQRPAFSENGPVRVIR